MKRLRFCLFLATSLCLSACFEKMPTLTLTPEPSKAKTAVSQNHNDGHAHSQPTPPISVPSENSPKPVLVVPELIPAVPVPENATHVSPGPETQGHGDQSESIEPEPTIVSVGSDSHSSSGSLSHSSRKRSGSSSSGQSQPQHNIEISEIVLTETGESILGTDAPASIQPDYDQENIVSITIRGTFATAPSSTIEHMLFTMEPDLIHLGLVGKEPSVRVTLDNTILMTPVSASETEIVVTLNTQGIPDLYLKGLHTLTVAAGELLIEQKVRVGEPLNFPSSSLNPVITDVEVLYDEDNEPINLRLTGKNLMLQPKFSYAQIDGNFGFGHQTSVRQEEEGLGWDSIVHLPNPEEFDSEATHQLMYITPFGTAMTTFTGN